ncbi:uncharacterized protein LOC131876582 [Cryptomeria japonica]|uniref:uncharacterized protein LOC131876582 n=1 Tax=Cryptomeria japonica TaxID=3369 RepID=UPI0027D9F79B|nr:uncharacterized protein LOC131876582 [Cryptomeria japonica]
MEGALQYVEDNDMSIRGASRKWGVPAATLPKWLSCLTTMPKKGPPTILTYQEEEEIVQWCQEMAGCGHGLEIINLKAVTAEGLDKDQALCLRLAIVSTFYETLSKAYAANPYGPARIWNCAETRVMADRNEAMRVPARKGSWNVSYILSKSHEWITIVCCVNASRQSIPGFYMIKGKRLLHNYIAECEPGACMAVQQHAWMTKELFMNWLHHFKRSVLGGVSPTNRCLFIFDDHDSHVALPTIQEARMLGIDLLTLPAHTSHKLQPLNVSVFSPFKTSNRKETHG